MMVVNIPIEPVEGRYSEDWNKWFIEELVARKYNFVTVSAKPLTTKIREGAFLDVIGTTKYKADQISQIALLVDTGVIKRDERTVFLIQDGWFPVEQLAYMRDMLGCHNWKFIGLFHAGTYDKWDRTAQKGMYTWGRDLENSWFKIYDKIIVASEYHKRLLQATRSIWASHISVIPWKVVVPDIILQERIHDVVFPHRLDPEKQPQLFDSLLVNYGRCMTAIACATKDIYYKELARSKVCISFSLQETFGIAMVEAVLLGCIPLVPDRLSYTEMYPLELRYSDFNDMKYKLDGMIHNKDGRYEDMVKYLQTTFINQSKAFFLELFTVVESL